MLKYLRGLEPTVRRDLRLGRAVWGLDIPSDVAQTMWVSTRSGDLYVVVVAIEDWAADGDGIIDALERELDEIDPVVRLVDPPLRGRTRRTGPRRVLPAAFTSASPQ